MPAHQTDAVLPKLRRSAAGCIQFTANIVDPQRLQVAIGTTRCGFVGGLIIDGDTAALLARL